VKLYLVLFCFFVLLPEQKEKEKIERRTLFECFRSVPRRELFSHFEIQLLRSEERKAFTKATRRQISTETKRSLSELRDPKKNVWL
jgi:hypothetical protein